MCVLLFMSFFFILYVLFASSLLCVFCFFFFKQKTAYEMRISDWSSDVCSSDLLAPEAVEVLPGVDAGIMQVIELQAHGVVADRLDLHDADLAAPGDGLLLVRPVALHPGRGAIHAQELGRIGAGLAGLEADPQALRGGDRLSLRRPVGAIAG